MRDMIDVLGLDRDKYTPEYLEAHKVKEGEPCQLFDRFAEGYCSQNNYNCETCSLVNYGRDCHNNPLPD